MEAERSASNRKGPCIRFEGIKLELSSFAGCQFDFAKDGSLVLTFKSYSGTVTLCSPAGEGQPQQLFSQSSGSGRSDVPESTDVEMALSQLEQESATSEVGIDNPLSVREACEGGAQEPTTSPHKPNRIVKASKTGDTGADGPTTVVSPGSSSKRKVARRSDAQTSPLSSAAKRAAAAVATAVDHSPPGPARSSRSGSGRVVSPDAPFLSVSGLKSKGKRARRARDEAPKEMFPGVDAGSIGAEGAQSKPTSQASPKQKQPARGTLQRSRKQQKRGEKRKTPSVVEEASVEESGAACSIKDVVIDCHEGPPDSIAQEHAEEIDDNSTDDDAHPRVTKTQSSRGSPLRDSSNVSPVPCAAAAWIASAATSSPSPGPLSRSAKAAVVETQHGSTVGDSSGGMTCRPMGRWGHSATMITESRMLVLGGQADDEAQQATLGDLYKYDFETQTWSRPMNCDSTPRAWHTASFIPGKNLLVIFGGERTIDGCPECLDDIMVLDTDIDLWYPPAISGKSPTSRSGHSAAIIGTDLVVFGGVRGRKWQNNVAVLDTERWHWRHPTIDGSNPAPRSYHSATVVGNSMVVFGGNNQNESFDRVYVLDTSKARWEWFCPEVVGAAPAARTGHTALLLPDGYTILIHGGWDPEDEGGVKNFGDAYLLDTRLWEWSRGPESLLRSPCDGSGSDSGDSAEEEDDVALRVGHTALLSRNGNSVGSDGEGGVDGGDGERGWKVAFMGGQDGAGVRRSDLALLPL